MLLYGFVHNLTCPRADTNRKYMQAGMTMQNQHEAATGKPQPFTKTRARRLASNKHATTAAGTAMLRARNSLLAAAP